MSLRSLLVSHNFYRLNYVSKNYYSQQLFRNLHFQRKKLFYQNKLLKKFVNYKNHYISNTKIISRENIITWLDKIIHPKLQSSIVKLHMIKEILIKKVDENDSKYKINITIGLDQHYREIKKMIIENLSKYESVASVNVSMSQVQSTSSSSSTKKFNNTKTIQHNSNSKIFNGLEKVKNIVAVASCKGGVGKSTIAANLALALSSKSDYKIGIFDADVYGPSLPTLLKIDDSTLRKDSSTKLIIPPVYKNVKTMSFGFVKTGAGDTNPKTGSAIIRGPMVSNIVSQLCRTTQWGELDYLILDFPPGTGDIQITLCQNLKIDAAVIVTTPQKLSFIDVVKGIDMFDKVCVPSIAVVENMSKFVCKSCNAENRLFGIGHSKELQELFGIKNFYSLPVYSEIAQQSDFGHPFVLNNNDSQTTGLNKARQMFHSLADQIVFELKEIKKYQKDEFEGGKRDMQPKVYFSKELNKIILELVQEQKLFKISSKFLRSKCGCVMCIDHGSNKKINLDKIPENIQPINIRRVGNYAVSIKWSDGHDTSIYPYKRIIELSQYEN